MAAHPTSHELEQAAQIYLKERSDVLVRLFVEAQEEIAANVQAALNAAGIDLAPEMAEIAANYLSGDHCSAATEEKRSRFWAYRDRRRPTFTLRQYLGHTSLEDMYTRAADPNVDLVVLLSADSWTEAVFEAHTRLIGASEEVSS